MVSRCIVRYFLQAIFAGLLAFALCGCNEEWKREVLVDTFFLPDDSRETVDASFRLCDTVNHKALHWISKIYAASSSVEVLTVFTDFRDSFNILQSSSSWEDFKTIHEKVTEIATQTSEPYFLKQRSAYLLAGFLHRFYLRNADNLRKSLKYLQPIYFRTMDGDIPDCVAKGKSTIHPAVRPGPWVFFGGLTLLLILIVWLWRLLKPSSKQTAISAALPDIKPPGTSTSTGKNIFEPRKQAVEVPQSQPPSRKPRPSPPTKEVEPVLAGSSSPEYSDVNLRIPPLQPPPVIIEVSSPQPEPQAVLPPAKPKPALLYARLPSSGYFYQFGQSFEPNETFFALSISPDDPITASVSLVTDRDTLDYLFTRMNYQEACELLGAGMPAMANIREVEPGKARLSNGMWIMQSKIKIDW